MLYSFNECCVHELNVIVETSPRPLVKARRTGRPRVHTVQAIWLGLIFAVLLPFITSPAFGQNDAIRACDLAAASPSDNARPSAIAGVAFDKVNSANAVAACQSAIGVSSNTPRLMYELGRAFDVGKNNEQALIWYRKAADQRYAAAQYNLGVMYSNGQGVPQDYAVAISWYRKAADQGNVLAQQGLGNSYLNGQGVPQDYAAAVPWLRKAADQGDADSQAKLGAVYYAGLGVAKDYATAASWFLRAANQGDDNSQYLLGEMYREGRGVPQNYPVAVDWYRKAAGQGDADAEFHLGEMYNQGHGVPQDYVAAVQWFRKAANQGNYEAQAGLGLLYAEGQGVPQNFVQAYMWLDLASANLPLSDTKLRSGAIKLRDHVASLMTPAELAEAQSLAAAWTRK